MQPNKCSYQRQKDYELTFSKKGIQQASINDLENTADISALLAQAVATLENWMHDKHAPEKTIRLQTLLDIDLKSFLYQLLATICLECQQPMKLVAIASMSAKHLKQGEKVERIQTLAEIIAVLCEIDFCDLFNDRHNCYWVHSLYTLDPAVTQFKSDAISLPPLLIQPRTLRHNRDSGYLTQQGQSLILGDAENHHEYDLCLDVLNTLNANQYSLDLHFISTQQEQQPTVPAEQYDKFKQHCYLIKSLILYHGNCFYLQHRVDKRGRLYASGYHISTQGNSFKKACINLKNTQHCTGLAHWQTVTSQENT